MSILSICIWVKRGHVVVLFIIIIIINVLQVLLSPYTVPYDQVSFSDLNIYPYPRLSRYKPIEYLSLAPCGVS